MKAVMLSIQPKWTELIASGKKTVEVRKTKPKSETPFKCYIYCTKGKDLLTSVNGKVQKPNNTVIDLSRDSTISVLNGSVIGEFVCDRITEYECSSDGFGELATTCGTCLTYDEILNYCNGNDLYGWHISNLVIYYEPKELSEFVRPCNHENDCFTCDRYDYIGHKCYNKITRPPQSYMFVEELLQPLSEPKGKTIQFKKWTYDEHKGETE